MMNPSAIRLPLVAAMLLSATLAAAAPPTPLALDDGVLLPDGAAVTVAVRSITADVALRGEDGERVAAKILDRLRSEARGEAASRYRIDVAITEYDKGNLMVRSMVSGLAEIHADLALTIYAAGDGAVVGRRQLSVTRAPMVVGDSASRIADIEDAIAQVVSTALQGSGVRIAQRDR